MNILEDLSVIIFLDVSLNELEKRLKNKAMRGVVGLNSKSIKELYN